MSKMPNIILINADDLGYGDTGCYGSTLNDTPALDALAAQGMMFTDFYAPAPVCTPSRAGLLTGCYPKRLDFMMFDVYNHLTQKRQDEFVVLMPGQPQGLNPEELTLAQVLKAGGYQTRMIGKWHLGDQPCFMPTRFGFDHYTGIPYSNDMGVHHPRGALRKMDYTLCPLPLVYDEEVVDQQFDQSAINEYYTREACRYIKNNSRQPFFLYFAHMYVHHPLFVPKRFMKTSRNGLMGGAVAAIDWSLAVIDVQLRELGLWDNTLVIFTSDNGGDLRSRNTPLRGYKGSQWEGGFRVNCIMRWPDVIRPGTVCREIATMMDFLPTFAEIAGIPIEDGVKRDGYSLYPLFKHSENYCSPYEAFFYYRGNDLVAVRQREYKLHLREGELYNLLSDIGESTDVANTHPDKVACLRALAKEMALKLGDGIQQGCECRSKGFVTPFAPMTWYDEDYPYMIAFYDLEDAIAENNL